MSERAITLRLPADLHDQLRERAELEERSMSSLIRWAARQYLANVDRGTTDGS